MGLIHDRHRSLLYSEGSPIKWTQDDSKQSNGIIRFDSQQIKDSGFLENFVSPKLNVYQAF
jgi:hypothetical protein